MPRPRKVQPTIQAEPLMSPVSGITTAPHATGALTVSTGRAKLADVPGGYAPAYSCWEYTEALSWDGKAWEWGDPPTPVTFNVLGALGWELVTIYAVWDAHTAPRYRAVFKRKKQEEH